MNLKTLLKPIKGEKHANNDAFFNQTILSGITGKPIHFTKKSEYITYYQNNNDILQGVVTFIEQFDEWNNTRQQEE